MRKTTNKAFTLVELLVVITILSIISVVAYQNFWGAVDKAVSGRKISDVSTIETWLETFKADKNYFPKTDVKSPNNLWWFTWSMVAYPSNTIKITYDWQEIKKLDDAKWGWIIYWSWSLWVIWAKWTISQKTLWKKYLTTDLYDPELWDIKIIDIKWDGSNEAWKMIDKWIWRYVYSIYKKGALNTRWNDYSIAYTIRKSDSDEYITKVVGTYDEESCYDDKANCPTTLIWTLSWATITGNNIVLKSWDSQKMPIKTKDINQWIPYAVWDFSE